MTPAFSINIQIHFLTNSSKSRILYGFFLICSEKFMPSYLPCVPNNTTLKIKSFNLPHTLIISFDYFLSFLMVEISLDSKKELSVN